MNTHFKIQFLIRLSKRVRWSSYKSSALSVLEVSTHLHFVREADLWCVHCKREYTVTQVIIYIAYGIKAE